MSPSAEPAAFPSTLDIRRTANYGLSVFAADSDKPLLFIACHESKDTPDTIVHDEANAEPGSHGPYVAQARLLPHAKDTKIFVGDSKDVHEWDWDVVRHFEEKKGLFRSSIDSFRFECKDPAIPPNAKYGKRKLAWTEFGKGFELIEEGTGVVLATFVDKSTFGEVGFGKTLGRLEWKTPCSRHLGLAALVSIVGVVERKRRSIRQVARAVAWQAGPGRGPVGSSGLV